jgi:dihydroxy-acid dehydratase
VLHYLAIASAAGVEWTIDDFERVRRACRSCATSSPRASTSRPTSTARRRAAGAAHAARPRVLHGDCITITGRRIGEELERVPAKPRDGQDVIRPWDKPMYAEGHLAILRGNLRAEGCVAKITGLKNPSITGPARVFDSERSAWKRSWRRRSAPATSS